MRRGFADLHLHTIASDGTDSLAEVVPRAKAAGLRTIAITDHDVVSPELTAVTTVEHGIEIIAGAELKVDFDGVTGEMLAYFVDPYDTALKALQQRMADARTSRMQEMVERCARETGLDLDFAQVRASAAGNLGRPHMARLLVAHGAVASTEEAFRTLLTKGRPCYVPIDKLGYREVLDIVHGASGVASVAHPCLMSVEDWPTFLDRLKQAGVDGMEAIYPYRFAHRGLSIAPRLLHRLAVNRGFLVTGGSDDHGVVGTKQSLGSIRLAPSYVDALWDARPSRAPESK